MEIIGLELNTTQLAALADFYTTRLGLTLLHADENAATWQVGHTVLTFRRSDEPVPPYHFAFNVPVGSLRRQYDRLAEAGIEFIRNPDGGFINDFSNWKAEAFYFFDPAGNILECIDRQDLARYPSAAAENGPFVGVSEIGLVADDALDASEVLEEMFGVSTFDKHRHLGTANFNAVGDDRGLFILATEGRAWFPTDVPARQGFVRVVSQCGRSGRGDRARVTGRVAGI